MIRRFLFEAPRCAAGILATCLAVSAPAQAQGITEYLGGGFLTPMHGTTGCADYGWNGVHQLVARLQPQGARGNPDDDSQLSLMLATGTIALRYNLDRGIKASYTPSLAAIIWNGPYVPAKPEMRLEWYGGTWPVGNMPEFPQVRLRVENFNEHIGCTVDISLFLRRNR